MMKPNGGHCSLGSKWKMNQPVAFHSKKLLNVPLPAKKAPPPALLCGGPISTHSNADTGSFLVFAICAVDCVPYRCICSFHSALKHSKHQIQVSATTEVLGLSW
jgi:hypothetical protein